LGKNIRIEEDLRERRLSGTSLSNEQFWEAKRKVFAEPDFSFPGGESSAEAQQRAIRVIQRLLQEYGGKRIVVGTHGDIMTLMMNHYDYTFDFHFWKNTTMPDIYRLGFDANLALKQVARLWN